MRPHHMAYRAAQWRPWDASDMEAMATQVWPRVEAGEE